MRPVSSIAIVLLGMVGAVHIARAQSLEDRVLGASADIVRMTYEARPGVCGDGETFRIASESHVFGWRYCEPGPVRLQIEKEERRVTRIRIYTGGRWDERAGAADLGDVPASDAVEFLLDLVAAVPASVAEDGLTAAVIADAADPWQRLLELARDEALSKGVRSKAVFWVGLSAAREATRGLAEIVDDDDETSELMKAAVFALARRDEPERLDQLIRIARTHENPEVVKAALFWIAESEDERALDLFEEILLSSEIDRPN